MWLRIVRAAWPVVLTAALACGSSGSPTAPSSANPATVVGLVTNGVTGQPVAGARVAIRGVTVTTDAAGAFETSRSALGSAVDVDADGYLPRRTTLLALGITLWPATSQAEREAIRVLAFDEAGTLLRPPTVVVNLVEADGDEYSLWTGEMSRLTKVTSVSFIEGDYWAAPDASESLTIRVTSRLPCSDPRGFCREDNVFTTLWVTPAGAHDLVIARRALLSMVLGANSLDGMMNPANPQPALSPLESNTLTMIGRRTPGLRWPDSDVNR